MKDFYELHGLQTVRTFYSREELVRTIESEPLSLFMKVFHVPAVLAFDGSSAQGVLVVRGGPVEIPIEELLA